MFQRTKLQADADLNSAASTKPRKTRGLFYLLTFMTIILWTAYPIVFGLTEGANKISIDAEIISYGVLDVAAKLGFTFILLILHEGATVETGKLSKHNVAIVFLKSRG